MAAEGVIFAIQQRERVLCVYLATSSLSENHCLSELRLPSNLRAPPLLHVTLLVLVAVFRQYLPCSVAPTASLWAFRISQPGPSADFRPGDSVALRHGPSQDDDNLFPLRHFQQAVRSTGDVTLLSCFKTARLCGGRRSHGGHPGTSWHPSGRSTSWFSNSLRF